MIYVKEHPAYVWKEERKEGGKERERRKRKKGRKNRKEEREEERKKGTFLNCEELRIKVWGAELPLGKGHHQYTNPWVISQ